MFKNKKRGFTLVEILLVIAIIAILAGIVLVAINPTRQIKQANDAQRQSDVNQILKAINSYASDHRGALPEVDPTTAPFPTANTYLGSAAGQYNICDKLVADYIAELPYDPTHADAGWTSCTTFDTRYYIKKETSGRVTVSAPHAELSTITVTQ